MHVIMINASPRAEKMSNTGKILEAFERGLTEAGVTCETFAISQKASWEEIRYAYETNTEILIALPLFVECVPGLLLEFLETLPIKDSKTRLSFLLQSGFAEASQLRCGEAFLKKLPEYLGVTYGGTLIKGDNFGIRVCSPSDLRKLTDPFGKMGRSFAKGNGFFTEEAAAFAGPEYFSLPMRLMLQIMFHTVAKKKYAEVSKSWGCERPLDDRPFEREEA